MKKHWTERSIKDYVFRIAADFIAQLEKKIESLPITQDELAKRLEVTKGRVSQFLNHPGNVGLAQMVEYARTLGMKISIVAYEDDDPDNKKGPIDSEIFRTCWEKSGKPHDFWALQDFNEQIEVAGNSTNVVAYASINEPIYPIFTGKIQIISNGNFAYLPRYSVEKRAFTKESLEETKFEFVQ